MPIIIDLMLSFFKIGLFTIGGGYAMIPLIAETTIAKGWISEEMLINFIAIAESTPGPFAVNMATFIGYQMAGVLGVFFAVLGLALPSFIIILIIYYFSKKFINNVFVQDAFTTLRPTVSMLIFTAFISVFVATILPTDGATGETTFNWFGIILFAVCFACMRIFKKLHPIILIILSAGIGILFYGFVL